MTLTKTGSPFYLLSLSNMLDLIHRTSVHSSSLLYFDDPLIHERMIEVKIPFFAFSPWKFPLNDRGGVTVWSLAAVTTQ